MQAGKIPYTAVFQSPPTGNGTLDSPGEGWPPGPMGFDPAHHLISTAYRAQYVADVLAHPDGAAPVNGSAPNFTTTAPTPACAWPPSIWTSRAAPAPTPTA